MPRSLNKIIIIYFHFVAQSSDVVLFFPFSLSHWCKETLNERASGREELSQFQEFILTGQMSRVNNANARLRYHEKIY